MNNEIEHNEEKDDFRFFLEYHSNKRPTHTVISYESLEDFLMKDQDKLSFLEDNIEILRKIALKKLESQTDVTMYNQGTIQEYKYVRIYLEDLQSDKTLKKLGKVY